MPIFFFKDTARDDLKVREEGRVLHEDLKTKDRFADGKLDVEILICQDLKKISSLFELRSLKDKVSLR